MRYRKSTEFRVVISRVRVKSCEIVRDEWRCRYLENHESTVSGSMSVTVNFRGCHETEKNCGRVFWRVFLVFSGSAKSDGGRRNASGILICTLCILISVDVFSFIETIFDGARWTDGDFRLLFTLTRVRLFTFSIGFFVDRLSFHYEEKKKRFNRTITVENIYFKVYLKLQLTI